MTHDWNVEVSAWTVRPTRPRSDVSQLLIQGAINNYIITSHKRTLNEHRRAVRDGSGDSHRRTGRGVRGGGSWPPNSGRYMTFIRAKDNTYSGKDNTFVWLTVSPRTEQVSIYLRYISGGVTKETFIGYSLRGYRSTTVKNRHCNSSLLFFLPGGAAWQTSCFRHSGKTRFDPPNGCSPVRLWGQLTPN